MISSMEHAMRRWSACVKSIQGERRIKLVGVKGFAKLTVREYVSWLKERLHWGFALWSEDYREDIRLKHEKALRAKGSLLACRVSIDVYLHHSTVSTMRMMTLWKETVHEARRERRRQGEVLAGVRNATGLVRRHYLERARYSFLLWEHLVSEIRSSASHRKGLREVVYTRVRANAARRTEDGLRRVVVSWLGHTGTALFEQAREAGATMLKKAHLYHFSRTVQLCMGHNSRLRKEWGWGQWRRDVSVETARYKDGVRLVALSLVNFCNVWRIRAYREAFFRWIRIRYLSQQERSQAKQRYTSGHGGIIMLLMHRHHRTGLCTARLVSRWRVNLLMKHRGVKRFQLFKHLIKRTMVAMALQSDAKSAFLGFTVWCSVVSQAREDRLSRTLGGSLLYQTLCSSSQMTRRTHSQMLARWCNRAKRDKRATTLAEHAKEVDFHVAKSILIATQTLKAARSRRGLETWRFATLDCRHAGLYTVARLTRGERAIRLFVRHSLQGLMLLQLFRWKANAVDLSESLRLSRVQAGLNLLWFGRLKVRQRGQQDAVVALLNHALERKRVQILDAARRKALKRAVIDRCESMAETLRRAMEVWSRWSETEHDLTVAVATTRTVRERALMSLEKVRLLARRNRLLWRFKTNMYTIQLVEERVTMENRVEKLTKSAYVSVMMRESNRLAEGRKLRAFCRWRGEIITDTEKTALHMRIVFLTALRVKHTMATFKRSYAWRLWIDHVYNNQANARIERLIAGGK